MNEQETEVLTYQTANAMHPDDLLRRLDRIAPTSVQAREGVTYVAFTLEDGSEVTIAERFAPGKAALITVERITPPVAQP